MAPTKTNVKNWREIKQERKKWKELKLLKKNLKLAKEHVVTDHAPTNSIVSERKTYSLAVPGSILENAQSRELRAYVAGQVARAACIYRISEVVVFDDCGARFTVVENGAAEPKKCCRQFARLLQYLECPQYLRKHFFPLHSDLQHAGLMNPLDAPHHLRQEEECQYREGITTDMPVKVGKEGTYVNVGLLKEVLVDKKLAPRLRVTVKIKNYKATHLKGVVVSPDIPFREADLYWGYTVRIAKSLCDVFSKCPYSEGYDLTIGTSDKGKSIDELKRKAVKDYKHALIVFGGLQGLEAAIENDEDIKEEDPSLLFDHYINTCPNQASRTIRTEEAILITLAELRKKI